MRSKLQHKKILNKYPEYISKDVMYKLCHISKRTALYLLESGLIPCTNSGKQTRKYRIATKDVVEYLVQRELQPERYLAPEGWYKGKGKHKNDFVILPPETSEKIRDYLEHLMENYPDVLNVQQLAEITGYTYTTVVRWCSSKNLFHLCIRGKFKIPKTSLLDFMMSTDFWRIRTKSEKHREFIMDFRNLG